MDELESGKPEWQNFLEHNWQFYETLKGFRFTGYSIKASYSGMLCTLRRVSVLGKEVAWVGGKSFPGLATKMRAQLKQPTEGWREDKF